MNARTTALSHAHTVDQLHHAFLILLPKIETHARICFRDIKCSHKREDSIAETVALAWSWYLRLVQRGKHVHEFTGVFARFAARAVKCGRRVCGQEKRKDVLSRLAQMRRGFTVQKLPELSAVSDNPLTDALADNTMTPPDEQAMFRIDFPGWLRSRSDRDRRIVGDLMMGERTGAVSQKYGVTAARISQLRRDFLEDWRWYCGDVDTGLHG